MGRRLALGSVLLIIAAAVAGFTRYSAFLRKHGTERSLRGTQGANANAAFRSAFRATQYESDPLIIFIQRSGECVSTDQLRQFTETLKPGSIFWNNSVNSKNVVGLYGYFSFGNGDGRDTPLQEEYMSSDCKATYISIQVRQTSGDTQKQLVAFTRARLQEVAPLYSFDAANGYTVDLTGISVLTYSTPQPRLLLFSLAIVPLSLIILGSFLRSKGALLVIAPALSFPASFAVAVCVMDFIGSDLSIVGTRVVPVLLAMTAAVTASFSALFLRMFGKRCIEMGADSSVGAADCVRYTLRSTTGGLGLAGAAVGMAAIFITSSIYPLNTLRFYGIACAVSVVSAALVTLTFCPSLLVLAGRFILPSCSLGTIFPVRSGERQSLLGEAPSLNSDPPAQALPSAPQGIAAVLTDVQPPSPVPPTPPTHQPSMWRRLGTALSRTNPALTVVVLLCSFPAMVCITLYTTPSMSILDDYVHSSSEREVADRFSSSFPLGAMVPYYIVITAGGHSNFGELRQVMPMVLKTKSIVADISSTAGIPLSNFMSVGWYSGKQNANLIFGNLFDNNTAALYATSVADGDIGPCCAYIRVLTPFCPVGERALQFVSSVRSILASYNSTWSVPYWSYDLALGGVEDVDIRNSMMELMVKVFAVLLAVYIAVSSLFHLSIGLGIASFFCTCISVSVTIAVARLIFQGPGLHNIQVLDANRGLNWKVPVVGIPGIFSMALLFSTPLLSTLGSLRASQPPETTDSECILKALEQVGAQVVVMTATAAVSFAGLFIIPDMFFNQLAFVLTFGSLFDGVLMRGFLLPDILLLLSKYNFPCTNWASLWFPRPRQGLRE